MLAVYNREFKTICDALSSIGKPIEEFMKTFGFLNGLGREFDPISTVIQSSLTKYPLPTFNDVVSEVQGFDSKVQSYEANTTVSPHLVFNTQKENNTRRMKQLRLRTIRIIEADAEVATIEGVGDTPPEDLVLCSIRRKLVIHGVDMCVRFMGVLVTQPSNATTGSTITIKV